MSDFWPSNHSVRTAVLSSIGALLVAAVGAAYATEVNRIDRMEDAQVKQSAILVVQGQDIAVIKTRVESIDKMVESIDRKLRP